MNSRGPAGGRDYWEENLERWSRLYLQISHSGERFGCPRWLEWTYHRLLTPMEARLMRERYERTLAFLDHHVRAGATVGDLGCGSGIFTVECLKRGARVVSVDFAQASLDMTRELVERHCPQGAARLQLVLMDLAAAPIPPCDLAFAMGVTPYIDDIDAFFANVLGRTRLFYCLMVDPDHAINRIRRALPFLNVRGLRFQRRQDIDAIYRRHGWRLRSREDFATGYLDLAERAP